MDKSPLMFDSDEDSLLNEANESEDTDGQIGNDCEISEKTACKESKILKNLQTVMMGIPPPPSFTVPQLDAREILKLWRDHESYRVVLSPEKVSELKNKADHKEMEAKNAKWPEVLGAEHYDVYYNNTAVSEELASLFVRYKERYVGAETSTSVNAQFARSPTRTASARKRARTRAWGHSPGRRLSHLARRRKAFSSANLCSVAGGSNPDKKMILVEIKKRQKKKSSVKKAKPTPKKKSHQDANYKRALFQSPDQKPRKRGTQTPNTKGMSRSKQNIFVESSGEKEVNENGKRERPTLRRMSPRKKVNRSLSFQDSGPAFQQPTSASANQTVLYGAHKQKMLWAATNALRDDNMGMNHELFRSCMSVLFKACQKLWLTKMLFNQEGSTSENMLKLAKSFSAYTIKEISSDPTSNHMALVCSNIVKMGEKTLDCVKDKVLSGTPKQKCPETKSALDEDIISENRDTIELNESKCSMIKSKKSRARAKTPLKSNLNIPMIECDSNNEVLSQSGNKNSEKDKDFGENSLVNSLDTMDFTSPLTRSRKALLLKNTPTKPSPSNSSCIDSTKNITTKQNRCSEDTKPNLSDMNFLKFSSSEAQVKISPHVRKTPKKNVEIVSENLYFVESSKGLESTFYNCEPVITRSLHSSGNTPKKVEISSKLKFEMAGPGNSIDRMVNVNGSASSVCSFKIENDPSPRLTRSRTSNKYTPIKPAHLKSSLFEQSPKKFIAETMLSENCNSILVEISPTKETPNKNCKTVNKDAVTVLETESPNFLSPTTRSRTLNNTGSTPKKSEVNSCSSFETAGLRSIIGQVVDSNKSESIENDISTSLTRSRTSSKYTPTKPTHLKSSLFEQSPKKFIAETMLSENCKSILVEISPTKETLNKNCKTVNKGAETVLETKSPNFISPTTRSRTVNNTGSTLKKSEVNSSSSFETAGLRNIIGQVVDSNKTKSIENDISMSLTRSRTASKYTPTKPTHLKSSLSEESPMKCISQTKLSENGSSTSVKVSPTKETPIKNGQLEDKGLNPGVNDSQTKSSNCESPIKRSKTNYNGNSHKNPEEYFSCTFETAGLRNVIGQVVNSYKTESIENINDITPRITRSRTLCSNAPTNAANLLHLSPSGFQKQCTSEMKQFEKVINASVEISPSKREFKNEKFKNDPNLQPTETDLNTDSNEDKGSAVKQNVPDVIFPTGSWQLSISKSTILPEEQSNDETAEIKPDCKIRSLDVISHKKLSRKSKRSKTVQSHLSCSRELDSSVIVGSSSLIVLPSTSKKTGNSSTKQSNSNSNKNCSSATNKQKRLKRTKRIKNVKHDLVISPQPDLISPTTRLRKSQISKNNPQDNTLSDLCVSSVHCNITLDVDNEQPEVKMNSPDFISPRARLRSYVHSKASPTVSPVDEESSVKSTSVNSDLNKTPSKAKQRTKRFKSRMLSETRLKISKEFLESPLKPSNDSSIVKTIDVNQSPNLKKTPLKVRFDLEDLAESVQTNRSMSSLEEQKKSEVEPNSPQATSPTRASLNTNCHVTLSPSSDRLGSDVIHSESSLLSNHSSSKNLTRRSSSDSRPNRLRYTSGSGSDMDTKGSTNHSFDQSANDVEVESETNKENLGRKRPIDIVKNISRSSPKHLLSVDNTVPLHLLQSPNFNENDLVLPNALPGIHFEPPVLTAHWAEISEGSLESECPPSLVPHWENSPSIPSNLPDAIMTHWQTKPDKITSDKVMMDYDDGSYEVDFPSDDNTIASSVCAPFDFPLIDDSRSGFPSEFR